MADDKPLSDIEVYDRISAALDVLGEAPAKTTIGKRVLNGIRLMLRACLLTMTRATTPTVELWPAQPKRPKSDSRPEPQP